MALFRYLRDHPKPRRGILTAAPLMGFGRSCRSEGHQHRRAVSGPLAALGRLRWSEQPEVNKRRRQSNRIAAARPVLRRPFELIARLTPVRSGVIGALFASDDPNR
jgi:hypothetical protein